MHLISTRGPSAPRSLWGILLAVGILHACASAPVRDITVHDGPQGAVYLARVPGAFQASHPLLLDETLIMRLLRGIQVEPRQGKVTTFIFGAPEPVRAFSDQEAKFLAPLIATALAQAAPHHIVEFQIMHSTPSGPEATAATLYAHGSLLYLTLTQYRYKLERPDRGTPGTSSDRESPDFTGLYQREVRFVPEAALSRDTEQAPKLPGQGQLTPLIINQDRLARIPEPTPAAPPRPLSPAASASPPSAPATVPDPPPLAVSPSPVPATIQTELERLKEENRLLRRQLAEQAAALKELQEKQPKAKEQKKKKRPAK